MEHRVRTSRAVALQPAWQHGRFGSTLRKRQIRYRRSWVMLLLAAIALLVSVSFFFAPKGTPRRKRIKTKHVNHRFTILNEPELQITHGITRNSSLHKPFRWYRDHWYQQLQPAQSTTATSTWNKTSLPRWMKDYFAWHRQQTLKSTNDQRYLVLQCLEQDKQCGGLADRLMALPFLILLAAECRRILLIVWTVPFPLEEFFMPPINGMDWMLPTNSIHRHIRKEVTEDNILSAPSIVDKTVFARVRTLIPAAHNMSLAVVRARIQDYGSAWEYYDQHQPDEDIQKRGAILNKPPHDSLHPSLAMKHYREIFWSLFEPSPPLAKVQKERQPPLDSHHPYTVAHYRALYGPQTPSRAYMLSAGQNAVNCASELLPGAPVVFLTESSEAMQSMEDITRNGNHNNSSTSSSRRQPLHLDKATRSLSRPINFEPADFYDTFLDMLLMANASCVSFGQGGFGKMGSLLSRNQSCTKRHFENGRIVPCRWQGSSKVVATNSG